MVARTIVMLLLSVSSAWAQTGECKGIRLQSSGVSKGCAKTLDLNSGDFAVSQCVGDKCIQSLSTAVTRLGSCIGAASSLCGTVDLTGKIVDASAATSEKIPVGTGAGPTADGSARWHSSLNQLEIGTGTVTSVLVPAIPRITIGGLGTDGGFTYGGEGAGACSGDICRGGVCTGSTPTGTCTLTLNSQVGRSVLSQAAADSNAANAYVGNYTTFSWTAGTITIDATNPSITGWDTIIRATGAVTFSGSGTFNLRGKGGNGGAGAANSANAAGKDSGATTLFQRKGATGTGKAGFAAPDLTRMLFFTSELYTLRGTGGGAAAGASAGVNLNSIGWLTLGATGGTGGGCTSTTVAPGAAGHGGGFLLVESGGAFQCSGVKIDVRGNDGAGFASGGGGGGGVMVFARDISSTCAADTGACSTAGRVCTSGGAAGAASGVCSAGGAGGTGVVYYAAVPQ